MALVGDDIVWKLFLQSIPRAARIYSDLLKLTITASGAGALLFADALLGGTVCCRKDWAVVVSVTVLLVSMVVGFAALLISAQMVAVESPAAHGEPRSNAELKADRAARVALARALLAEMDCFERFVAGKIAISLFAENHLKAMARALLSRIRLTRNLMILHVLLMLAAVVFALIFAW